MNVDEESIVRNVAVFSTSVLSEFPDLAISIKKTTVGGISVPVGLMETEPPAFDPDAEKNSKRALVRAHAISCNYRDKALILRMAGKGEVDRFFVIGSEFAGEVLAVGRAVRNLRVGDRVMGNGQYPSPSGPGMRPGVPTDHAGREIQVFHEEKLIKIPDSMSYEIAAAFSIGAQTTYSMIRRLGLRRRDRVLVTAGSSNTSLFAIHALRRKGVEMFVCTTSPERRASLSELGPCEVFVASAASDGIDGFADLARFTERHGGFDAVIDPFFDLHLAKCVNLMNFGGRYVTCGMHDQFSHFMRFERSNPAALNLGEVMTTAMLKNLQLIGNCLGQTSDLQTAIDDFDKGLLPVVLDSTFSKDEVAGFLHRTYESPDRFGKVVYCFD